MDNDQLLDTIQQRLQQLRQSRWGTPRATYRLQLRSQCDFAGARALVPYFAKLGVSHLYLSPYLTAQPGSSHGYDVVQYDSVDPALGGMAELTALVSELRQHDLGHILDFVPNHMGVESEANLWWQDVLENGPSSPYSICFDIDWQPVKEQLAHKLLLPILGDQYGKVLESGEIQLAFADGVFTLQVYGRRLPVATLTYPLILEDILHLLESQLSEQDESMLELYSIISSIRNLPNRTETAPERLAERMREKEVIKSRLNRLNRDHPEVQTAFEQAIQKINGTPHDSATFDKLDQLIDQQAYRLCYWRVASDEINYRRFFDINGLAALCVEELPVFDQTHQLIMSLLAAGQLDGLRIDHIDGLFDPYTYLWRLQWRYLESTARQLCHELITTANGSNEDTSNHESQATDHWQERWLAVRTPLLTRLWEQFGGPDPHDCLQIERLPAKAKEGEHDLAQQSAASTGETHSTVLTSELLSLPSAPPKQPPPLYVVVEKILGPDESLPEDWPVAGTTGYDALNLLNGLFVDPDGLSDLFRDYRRFAGEYADFREIVLASKHLILRTAMASELQMLAHRLDRISEQHRQSRDFTSGNLRVALREILACFPVYRTYITPTTLSDRDRRIVETAVRMAKQRNIPLEKSVFDFVRQILLHDWPSSLTTEQRREREFFVGRFQQVTSPVMAKGVEDTCFYIYVPLSSLNEVGGEPRHGPTSPEDFHADNLYRQRRYPTSLIATTTHDTKRSEDVRARLQILSEVPDGWRQACLKWADLNDGLRSAPNRGGGPAPPLAPSRNDEYLFYQTLVGMWPIARRPADVTATDYDPTALNEAERETLVHRLLGYMEKSTREAKRHTSWLTPDLDYERNLQNFIQRALDPRDSRQFLTELRDFIRRLLPAGLYTGLAQVLLKMTIPGVPDLYQGQEIWDFSLVDPDNRRPVDFSYRQQLVDQLAQHSSNADEMGDLIRLLASRPDDDRSKLLVTFTCLQLRRQYPDLFLQGEYVPLKLRGQRSNHVCAFIRVSRSQPGRQLLVVAPRLIASLLRDNRLPISDVPCGPRVWQDTALEAAGLPTHWQNVWTRTTHTVSQNRLALAELLAEFPLGLFITGT